MYAEFLQAILTYVQALNRASAEIEETDGLTPYVDHLPVILSDCLQGWLVDEIGGTYSYVAATDVDQAWWDQRPWKRDQ